MAASLAGAAILLTGASSGIGRALALELGRRGATLLLTGRDATRLAATAHEVTATGGRAETACADLAEPGAARALVETALQRLGRLDALVNNAGYGLSAFLEQAPLPELDRLFAVNVRAVVEATQAALPALRATRGQVVNVGSVVGHRGLPALGGYCMTKAALASFSEALRPEVARDGVHVLQVEPGLTTTDFGLHRVVVGPHPRHFRSWFAMTPESVARRIARAMERRQRRLVMGLPGKALIAANALAPWLVERLLARKVVRDYGAAPSNR
ncbi:MAG: SDR family NAD(P)-dependent oxidoreductase [Planctomycetes bacterium]|nr:SDR family NAD(P)-dependent oxidoreductase [Planctomycetota bacterium]